MPLNNRQNHLPDVELSRIKESVLGDEISLSILFKSSVRLVKLKALELIILQISLQCLLILTQILEKYMQTEDSLVFGVLFFSLFDFPVGAFVSLLPLSALFGVYERGQFTLKQIIQRAFNKLFKYIWTILVLLIFVLLIFIVYTFMAGPVITGIGVSVSVFYLIFFIIMLILILWIFVPMCFLPYIIVDSKYYGVKAIRRAFRLVKSRKLQLFGYIIVVVFIITFISFPAAYLLAKGFALAYLLLIPASIVTLYGGAYNLLLYQFVKSKYTENNSEVSQAP